MGEARLHGLGGRLLDMLGRVEIGLAEGEAHHVLALGAELAGFLRHADDGAFIGGVGAGNKERGGSNFFMGLICHASVAASRVRGHNGPMKEIALVICALVLLAACSLGPR